MVTTEIADIETIVPQDVLEYETDYEIGQDNVEVMGLDIHNPVFFLSAGIVLLFSALTLAFPQVASDAMLSAKAATLETFDWLFAVTPVIIFIFCFGKIISKRQLHF
mgnify:CR=1 FL=1